jgi:hypothetical protein
MVRCDPGCSRAPAGADQPTSSLVITCVAASSASSAPCRARSPNLPKWVFTAPSTVHTSLERRSMASVRKPICRLLRMAQSVVGPASEDPALALDLSRPARDAAAPPRRAPRWEEEDREVGGVRRIQVLVVDVAGARRGRGPRARAPRPRPPRRPRARRLDQPLVVLLRELRVDRQPDASGGVLARAAGSRTPRARRSLFRVATLVSYCSGASSLLQQAPSCTSPQVPRVFTFVRTRFRSPTPAGERLHLAQAALHLLEPLADGPERLAQPRLERPLQLLVHRLAHLLQLGALSSWIPSQASSTGPAQRLQPPLVRLGQRGRAPSLRATYLTCPTAHPTVRDGRAPALRGDE